MKIVARYNEMKDKRGKVKAKIKRSAINKRSQRDCKTYFVPFLISSGKYIEARIQPQKYNCSVYDNHRIKPIAHEYIPGIYT